jgi:sulfur-oxidizing protein SoxY
MPSASKKTSVSRRGLLRVAGMGTVALAGASLLSGHAQAQAAKPGAYQQVLDKLVGGKKAQAGKVAVRMPEIAENGNTVPITVAVDHPMTPQDYVKSIHVVADDNPNPEVMSVHFTPASGKAEMSTRMRLAKTQHVIAYAELSDGSVWSGKAEAKVTIGGCGG